MITATLVQHPKFALHLNEYQVQMICAALSICAPSGGGSETFHLANDIMHKTGVDADQVLHMSYANTVVAEWQEANNMLTPNGHPKRLCDCGNAIEHDGKFKV